MTLKELDANIKSLQGDCNCICEVGNGEAEFSHRGCNVCSPGRGGDVYEVEGYNPKTGMVEQLGQVCIDCLCYIVNGDVPATVEVGS